MAKTQTFLSFSCPHFPLADDEACNWILAEIANRKPDVVVGLGDWHEANAASRWPNEYDWSLADEFEMVDKFMLEIRMAHPPSRRVWIQGNHDANILAINRISKDLRGLCDYRRNLRELEHWEHPCEYVYNKQQGTFRLGQVTFAHGFEHGQSGDEFQAILLGQYNGLFVSGHTHRPVPVTQAQRTKAIPLPYWYANAGCLRDLKPDYVSRLRTHAWGHAMVVGETQMVKSPRESPCWSAETVIYQMSSDLYPKMAAGY